MAKSGSLQSVPFVRQTARVLLSHLSSIPRVRSKSPANFAASNSVPGPSLFACPAPLTRDSSPIAPIPTIPRRFPEHCVPPLTFIHLHNGPNTAAKEGKPQVRQGDRSAHGQVGEPNQEAGQGYAQVAHFPFLARSSRLRRVRRPHL